jgi:hypothetical protein
MAQEVMARQDVVDLQAVPAGEPLADVALQEGVVADELLAFAITQDAIVGRSATGLAMERSRHQSFLDTSPELSSSLSQGRPMGGMDARPRRSIMGNVLIDKEF